MHWKLGLMISVSRARRVSCRSGVLADRVKHVILISYVLNADSDRYADAVTVVIMLSVTITQLERGP